MRANFVLSEVATGLRRNLAMTVAMIITTAISLCFFGAGLLVAEQIGEMRALYYDKLQVSIYLKDDITRPQREALQRQNAEGLRKRLVTLAFDDPAAYPWGGEPLLMDGRNVGELTSAGYSRKHGRAVAMGYAHAERILTDETLLAATFEVDIAGELFAVTPRLKLG